jgi:hypothetical protein
VRQNRCNSQTTKRNSRTPNPASARFTPQQAACSLADQTSIATASDFQSKVTWLGPFWESAVQIPAAPKFASTWTSPAYRKQATPQNPASARFTPQQGACSLADQTSIATASDFTRKYSSRTILGKSRPQPGPRRLWQAVRSSRKRPKIVRASATEYAISAT